MSSAENFTLRRGLSINDKIPTKNLFSKDVENSGRCSCKSLVRIPLVIYSDHKLNLDLPYVEYKVDRETLNDKQLHQVCMCDQ